MSLYTFAAASLTTPADHRRRPAIGTGQLVRTMILFAVFAAALAISVPRGNAADQDFSASVPVVASAAK